MGVSKFGHILERVGKGGQIWMGQTDRVRIGDMSSGLVWVCVQI